MARPSKLTPEVQARIVQALNAGSYLESAAAFAGITYQTFRNWMLRGERASSGPFLEFFKAVTRAESEAKITALEIWRSAFKDDWRAVQVWLERRYPDEWGRKDRVTLEHLLNQESEKIANDLGLSKEDVLADAERILASGG